MDEAFKARDAGVDALVVQGLEAGGHVRGSEPRDALLEAVARGTPQIPLCAAGGVASAAAAARVRALGADAVWVGTRFVATVESGAHPLYKQKLVEARAEDTALSMLFDGDWPNAAMRTLRNSTFRNWERAGRPLPGSRPGEGDILGMTGSTLIPRYHSDAPLARTAGEIEAMALYAGTGVDAIREVRSAREVLVELASAWAS
jgi:NAD(P)H-dependent flavin oxidoreductase YrpB (nitropropane dioxygenase family)